MKKKKPQNNLIPVSHLISASWKRVVMSKRRLGLLLLIQLLISGICLALFVGLFCTAGLSMVLSQIISLHSVSFAQFNSSIFILGSVIISLLWIGASFLLHIATIRVLQSSGQVSVTKILGQSLGIVPSFFVLWFVSTLFFFGGLFFFVIPIFFMLFFFSFAIYALVCDGYTPLGSLKRSMQLVASFPLPIAIRFVILLGIISVPSLLLSQFRLDTLMVFLSICVFNIVIGWFSISYMYELYRDVSMRVVVVKEESLLFFLLIAVFGWLLFLGSTFASYRFIASGNMQKFLRQDMYEENRAQYRIRPGASIEFSPQSVLKES